MQQIIESEEIEALRRLVSLMGIPGSKSAIRQDLSLFAHFYAWANAIDTQLESVQVISREEAVAIAKNAAESISGYQAETLLTASSSPSQSENILARMRGNYLASRKNAIAIAAAEAAAAARQQGNDALQAMENALKKEAAKIRREEIPPLNTVWENAKLREKAARNKQSGFAVSPKFAGAVSRWLNNWASPAGIFTAGRTLLIGAPSSGGKTTIGNIMACSAMESSLPVLYWQAELSVEEHLADIGRCWLDIPRSSILNQGIPKELDRLLHYPRLGETLRSRADMIRHIHEWADMMELSWNPSQNDCRGVVILDYLQLMEDPDQSDFKSIEIAASTLAQVAAERNLVAVILSQASKGSQTALYGELGKAKGNDVKIDAARRNFAETCFAGADVRRVAHVSMASMIEEHQEHGPAIRCLFKSKDRGAFDENMPDKIRWTMTRSGRMQELDPEKGDRLSTENRHPSYEDDEDEIKDLL